MAFLKKCFNYKTSLKLLMSFFHISCLLIVDFDGKSQSWRFLCSKKIAIFSVLAVNLLHLTWSVQGLFYLYFIFDLKNNLKFNSFDTIVGIVIDAYLVILAQLLRAMHMLRRKDTAEISNKIIRIIDYSNFLNNSSEETVKKSIFQAIRIFLVFLILWISKLFILYHNDGTEIFVFSRIPLILSKLIIHSIVLQYTFLMLLIEEFQVINEFLVKMNFQLSISNTIFQKSAILYKFKNACKLHSELFELSRQVSQFFSLPILLIIFQMFANMLLIFYVIVRPLVFIEVDSNDF